MSATDSAPARSLAAVVVTCNRAQKLQKTLAALLTQTRAPDTIYVIDNASTDDTPDVMAGLDDPRIRYRRLDTNTGGAGGFNTGIRLAYEDGHDLFWISDDDAYPAGDAIAGLENMLAAFERTSGRRAPFACSRVNWTDGSLSHMNTPAPAWDFPRWFSPELDVLLVNTCSFVSVLLPRWAVAEYGLPIRDYFIWHDDVEYTLRLSRDHPGLFCLNSVVVHDTERNEGATLANLTPANLWKHRYGVRNQASRRLRDEGHFGFLSYAVFVYRKMKAARIPVSLRFRIYRALLAGYRFSPEIEFPE